MLFGVTPGSGVVVIVGALILATAFGLWRRSTDGRVTTVAGPAQAPHAQVQWPVGAAQLGSRATLVQFSSPACQPCRTAHRLLAEIARTEPGVTHVELDAPDQLALVREFNVLRTPTVFVLDSAGRVRSRINGVPRPADVRAALTGGAPELSTPAGHV